jgi:hypothetical protein
MRQIYGSDCWPCKLESHGEQYADVVSEWFAENLEGHEHIWADNALRGLVFGDPKTRTQSESRPAGPAAPWKP